MNITVHINDLLQIAMEKDASDLHLVVGSPPMLRIGAELVPVPGENGAVSQALMEDIFSSLG